MRTCKRCNKQIPQDDAIFCPFCGKKFEIQKTPKSSLVDIMKFMTDDEWEKEFSEIKKMDSASAKSRLLEPRAFYIYGIKCHYERYDVNFRTTREHKQQVSLTELIDIGRNPTYGGVTYKLIGATAEEYVLSKTYSVSDIGETIWRTKKECIDAIQNALGIHENIIIE